MEDKAKKKKTTELLLNTPGACFLCLQDKEVDGGGPLEHLNGGIVELSNIWSYLKIIQGSLLSTSLQNDGGTAACVVEDFYKQLCTFSVNLCPKCLQLTEKLNDMILQLAKTKLMVNFHLLSFHKALEGNEEWEESLEWNNLLGRMHANPANSFEAKLVQLLREETRNSSSKMLKEAEAAMPQVILTKCQAPPPPPLPSPPSSITSDHSSPPPIPSISSGSTPAMKTLLSQLVRMSAKSSKKPVSCRLYRYPYCSKVLTHSTFAVHLSCVHADKLLSPYFPPSMPPFKKTCRKVLFAHAVVKAAKLASSSNPTAPRLGCHLCGITYSQGVQLKHHFLISHTAYLCEAINTFKAKPQKMELPIKKKTTKLPEQLIKMENMKIVLKDKRKTRMDKETCTICELTFYQDDKLRRHQARQHPDHLFLRCKPGWMGEEQFREIWGEVFGGEVKQATYGKPGDKIYKCGYCPVGKGTSYKRQVELIVHLVFQHGREMERKLIEEVEDGEEEVGGCLLLWRR